MSDQNHPSSSTCGEGSQPIPTESSSVPPPQRPTGGTIRKLDVDATSSSSSAEFGRFRFEYNGHKVYDFEQSLDDVTVYVDPPPSVVRGNQIICEISASSLKLRQAATDTWYLNEDTYDKVDVDESTWSIEDSDDGSGKKVIVIYLVKAHRGKLWEAVLKGNANANDGVALGDDTIVARIDPLALEQVRKDLLRQRFQEENAGFDFRGAEFNGSVPDAREFMGGLQYH